MTSDESTPPFPNAPLALTVLEIRYPQLLQDVGIESSAELRSRIHDHFPLMDWIQEQQIQLNVGGLAPGHSTVNRQIPGFTSRDRFTALVIRPEALVIETTAYGGWSEHFRPLAELVISAVHECLKPDGVVRVGLRYIDEIRVPSITDAPGEWSGYVDDHLLAAANSEFLPPTLMPTLWHGFVQYDAPADASLTVRYGPAEGYANQANGMTRRRNRPDPGLFFLLDSDSSWQATEAVPEFTKEWLLSKCDSLHTPVQAFFKAAATDALRDIWQEEQDS